MMDYTDIYDRWGNYIPLDLRDQFLKECLAKQEQLEKEREDLIKWAYSEFTSGVLSQEDTECLLKEYNQSKDEIKTN